MMTHAPCIRTIFEEKARLDGMTSDFGWLFCVVLCLLTKGEGDCMVATLMLRSTHNRRLLHVQLHVQ